jgi:glycosyltransferase involved in cell wall biosynthesis
MIDGALPARDSSAGERATFDLIDALHSLGHCVEFTALGTNGRETERLAALMAAGVDVLPGHGGGLKHLQAVLCECWDTVIVHRPGPALLAAEPLAAAAAVTLHWGHDIHTWRLEAQHQLCANVPKHKLMVTQITERRCWQAFDLTVYPTEREARYVNAFGGRALAVPYYRLGAEDLGEPRWHPSRRGCLMVGAAFHEPNRDAVAFAANEILPLLGPAGHITVVGEWPLECRGSLELKGVRFTGRVSEEELRQLHADHLCLLAPLRFGAGARRKLVAAMGLGLPVVTSHEGLRGLLVRDGSVADGVLIAGSAEQFADRVAELAMSPTLWQTCAVDGQAAVEAVYSTRAVDAAVARALQQARELHDGR